MWEKSEVNLIWLKSGPIPDFYILPLPFQTTLQWRQLKLDDLQTESSTELTG